MREKKMRLVVTFHNTTTAIEMEKICAEKNIPGRIIPVPTDISAGCGMAWSAPVESRKEVENIIENENLETEGFYEILI